MQTLTNACVGSLSSFCLYNTNIPTCFTTCTHPALFVAQHHSHMHTSTHSHMHTSTHTHAHLHIPTYHPPETPSVNVTPVSTAVNRSESVTLMCQAHGSPRPSIIWTKLTDTLEVDTRYISKIEGQPL